MRGPEYMTKPTTKRRRRRYTEGQIAAFNNEQEKILDTLIDAGSKARIERELDAFVDEILKLQPKEIKEDEEETEE